MKITTVSALLMSLVFFTPVHAEDTAPAGGQQAQAGTTPATGPGPIESRIRAHREYYDRSRTQSPDYDRALSPRQQEIHEQMQARRQAYLKQVEERRALAEQQREARRKEREAKLEAWMAETEERLARDIGRHESLRNQAEDRYNYLIENQERLLEESQQRQIEIASRQEELRKRSEERRKKLITLRERMKGMTPEERRAEIEKFRAEMYGERPVPRRAAPPPRMPRAAQAYEPPAAGSSGAD